MSGGGCVIRISLTVGIIVVTVIIRMNAARRVVAVYFVLILGSAEVKFRRRAAQLEAYLKSLLAILL